MKATFTSAAIRCGGCANNIKVNLPKVAGVRGVSVDPATKRVEVEYDEAAMSSQQVGEALEFLGYPAVRV